LPCSILGLGLRNLDLRQDEIIGGETEPLVEVGDGVVQFSEAVGGFSPEFFQSLLIDLTLESFLRPLIPLGLRQRNAPFEGAIEIRIEGAFEDLTQNIGAQRGQSIDLGLLDSEGFSPAVGPFLGLF
jgi:hypothetical protein